MKRWLIAGGIALALFAAVVVATIFLPPTTESMRASLTNPDGIGAMAVGEVLRGNGVQVQQVTNLAEAEAAPANSTLLVYLDDELNESSVAALDRTAADLVLVPTGYNSAVFQLSDGKINSGYSGSLTNGLKANCSDPDATAAGEISDSQGGSLTVSGDTVECFGDGYGSRYATTWIANRRITVVAGDDWLRNDTILSAGNAALALRVLGRHDRLTWYLPGEETQIDYDDTNYDSVDEWDILPPWSRISLALLVAAAASMALWRGRRFGKLVPEGLPVEVPAAEAGTGLARLYRQSDARGHAAAGLRAASLHRLARRLGLSATESSSLIIERLGQATGLPSVELQALYYGRPPATDVELVSLANELADLERKLTSRE